MTDVKNVRRWDSMPYCDRCGRMLYVDCYYSTYRGRVYWARCHSCKIEFEVSR